MSSKQKPGIVDELANGYEQMLEHAFHDFFRAEEKTEERLHNFVIKERDKAVELGQLSKQQAHRIAEFARRDLRHYLDYLSAKGRGVKEWLGFEAAMLETSILDVLLKAANPTTVDRIIRQSPPPSAVQYTSGEVTGPGTLVCDGCGESIRLFKTKTIPHCPECNGTSFKRRKPNSGG